MSSDHPSQATIDGDCAHFTGSSTEADNVIGEWIDDSLPADTDEFTDLDRALHQNARLRDGRDNTLDWSMKPIALLDTVDRLRHWSAASEAPQPVREAMGVLAQSIRERTASLHDADLINLVDQLRAQLAETDNTVRVSYTPAAPTLAEAGFDTYLPRDIEPVHAVVLTEDNLDQVAAAIGGKVLEGRSRRLSYPSIRQGPTMSVAHIGEALAQVPESQLDPWRVDIDQPRFYVSTASSLDRYGFLPGQPQHQQTAAAPAPAEDADIVREHAASLTRTNPAREEAGYKLDLALAIYDRLADGSQVLRTEQVHAARFLRDRSRGEISPLPQSVKQAMSRIAEWMITQPSSTQAPVTGKGDRYVDRHYNSYTDMGDGTLRSGPQRFLDYTPRESYAEVIFRHGRLTRVPLDD